MKLFAEFFGMRCFVGVGLVVFALGQGGCSGTRNHAGGEEYQELSVMWGESAGGLEIGSAPLFWRTPQPWMDFTKVYLKNCGDVPVVILKPPEILTHDDVIEVAQGSSKELALFTMKIQDKRSGATYEINSALAARATAITLQPGEEISVLIRLNLNIPQHDGENEYAVVWSYHVGDLGGGSAAKWKGEIRAPEGDVTVN